MLVSQSTSSSSGSPSSRITPLRAMRLLLDIADAVLRHQRAVAQAEAVERGAADAARGVAAGHDHGVDPLLGEVVGDTGLEEDRRALLGHLQVVIRLIDARIEPGA